jgi:hypothetical protein
MIIETNDLLNGSKTPIGDSYKLAIQAAEDSLNEIEENYIVQKMEAQAVLQEKKKAYEGYLPMADAIEDAFRNHAEAQKIVEQKAKEAEAQKAAKLEKEKADKKAATSAKRKATLAENRGKAPKAKAAKAEAPIAPEEPAK